MDGRPLAIDLFAGLGGWTEGLLAEGYRVVGFDIERHVYGDARYPAPLVLQDVTTLHGSQFKDAALIVASPPCQAYSYRAMPWKRAKALPPPDNTLFETCFRLQREANAVSDHYIPLVVENVCGAQKWVGRARWHFGSFYLWGDVPALMPIPVRREGKEKFLGRIDDTHRGGSWWDKTKFSDAEGERNRQLVDGMKNPGFRFDGSGRSFQTASVEGVKQSGISGVRHNGHGDRWFQDGAAQHGSKSPARKHASAQIAKIPFVLAQWIARAWYPDTAPDVDSGPLGAALRDERIGDPVGHLRDLVGIAETDRGLGRAEAGQGMRGEVVAQRQVGEGHPGGRDGRGVGFGRHGDECTAHGVG